MSFRDLGIPASTSTVTVRIFDVVSDPQDMISSAANFLSPVPPGYENIPLPIFAFLIQNNSTKQRVMFDLGIRKDLENAAPSVAELVNTGRLKIPVKKDIVEQLEDDKVDLESISAVIWSHSHVDHTGDMSKWPSSTDLVVSSKMVLETYESNPCDGRKVVPLAFDDESLPEIGGFKAHDYFSDGSLYILDVPGHQAGHTCALARVTPNSFLFLGADICHHPGVFRPTSKLHQHVPCPGALLAATRISISPSHVQAPSFIAGEFDLASRTTPLLAIPDKGYFEDPVTARASIEKMTDFDANADVLVVIAHDESLGGVIGALPASLDEWKAKGWKKEGTWAFLDEKNPAFRFGLKTAAVA
ncbi:Metallo-beta-lactamase superfamily protein [Mycena sanguinolenta]|uniref:Metallo-beta-lactamase superfamily protein n=1 Tax=Mycena sanguinolenta TaxID=230812 RepID=A0A8H6TW11_9AGAR|nr:Metallo-beta-lactamase superfamily protein [Mycena sanguinolenta]